MFLVIDASVVLEIALRRPAANAVIQRMFGESDELHAPHIIDVEAAHVIRRFRRLGEISDEVGREAIAYLETMPVERHPHVHLLSRIWALRENLTAYDAAYVALAEVLAAPLLTRDAKLARSSGHAARIEYID